jgi:hypothetical protein
LYASSDITGVTNTRRMRWAGNGRDKKCIQNFGQKNLKRRDHLEDLHIVGKILE